MRRFFFLALLLSLVSVEGRSSFLPRTFKAKFTKKEKAVLSGKMLEANGELYYRYPSHIRLEEKGKEESIFVSNPFKTYYYKPPVFEGLEGELTINESSSHPLSKFFDSLKKGLKTNDLFEVKKTEKKVELDFTKKGVKDLKILSANLLFDKTHNFSDLKTVEIVLDNKKKLVFQLEEIQTDTKFKKDFFKFSPPKNTRVSR